MKLKPEVDLATLKPILWFALGIAEATRRTLGFPPIVVTSGNDSKHRTDSYHYSNTAVDLRTFDLTKSQHVRWASALRFHLLPLGYVVLDEGDHIHIHHANPDPRPPLDRTA